MRILITAPWGEALGGAEAMLQAVLRGGQASGHELEVVFFEDGPWPAELSAEGFTVEVLSVGRVRQVHRGVATIARLTWLLRRRKPDLMLNWAAKTHLYGAPAAVLAGMSDRVVWWQQAIPRRLWLDVWATRLPAAAIGCYSRAAADAQARLSPSRRTFIVAAGAPVPAGEPAPAAVELPEGVPVVGLVGRLQPWKGQDRLLRAHALLRERGHRMHTLIVGGDAYGLSARYAESIPALVAELGLGEEVTMTGQVPDAGPYMARMDILVNASDPEPFGIVLLEGMARSLAVVAVASGGPKDFIAHEQTGVLARSGDPAALADALEPLLTSPERRDALGHAARESFMREFTDLAMCERFFGEMQKVLDDARARSGDARR